MEETELGENFEKYLPPKEIIAEKAGFFGKKPNLNNSQEIAKTPSFSMEILQKLEGNKAFQTTANNFGKAIAESILAKNRATKATRFNFGEEMQKQVVFNEGSYALIYKGNLPLRIVPFIWQLDQTTRKMWAIFTFNNFYGHKNPWQPWKRIKIPIVVTPFSPATEMIDTFGKGYLAKYDEGTQFQMALTIQDTAEAEKIRVDNKNFISAGLTLWQDLWQFTKAKTNMKLIYIIILIAAIALIAWWFWPMISSVIGNILPKAMG